MDQSQAASRRGAVYTATIPGELYEGFFGVNLGDCILHIMCPLNKYPGLSLTLAWSESQKPVDAYIFEARVPGGVRPGEKFSFMVAGRLFWIPFQVATPPPDRIILVALPTTDLPRLFGLSKAFWHIDEGASPKVQEAVSLGVARIAGLEPFYSGVEPPSDNLELVCEQLKTMYEDGHRLVPLTVLVEKFHGGMPPESVIQCLRYLSSLGFGLYVSDHDEHNIQASYVLSRRFLAVAVMEISQENLGQRVGSKLQEFITHQQDEGDKPWLTVDPDADAIQLLTGQGTPRVPLIYTTEAVLLWWAIPSMKKAAARYARLVHGSDESLGDFLLALFQHAGLLVPLPFQDSVLSTRKSQICLVPGSVDIEDNSYERKEPTKTQMMLRHMWHLEELDPDLWIQVVAAIMGHLHAFLCFKKTERHASYKSPPFGRTSRLPEYLYGDNDSCLVEKVEIKHVKLGDSSLFLRVSVDTRYHDRNVVVTSDLEVRVKITVMDEKCTNAGHFKPSKYSIDVQALGPAGHHGAVIWKGVLEVIHCAVSSAMAGRPWDSTVCPDCMLRDEIEHALVGIWFYGEVMRRTHSSQPGLVCPCCESHSGSELTLQAGGYRLLRRQMTNDIQQVLQATLPGIVLVGVVFNSRIVSYGSGFVGDAQVGLVLSAGHTIFDKRGIRHDFGCGQVVIGTVVDGNKAVWRYLADVASPFLREDFDACVLRITARFAQDVDTSNPHGLLTLPDPQWLDAEAIGKEHLTALPTTATARLGEDLWLAGFGQGGDGLYRPGHRINQFADCTKGYLFRLHYHTAGHTEVIVRCPTIVGHSGSPFVSARGEVVGLLTSADQNDPEIAYSVGGSVIQALIIEARAWVMSGLLLPSV